MGKPRNKNKNKGSKVVRKEDREAKALAKVAKAKADEEAKHAIKEVGDSGQVVSGGEYRSSTGVLTSMETSKDVKISNFSLISHSTLLISDTTLEFSIGRRYGLMGANGCGKTTLMRCLAAREVPIPDHIDIFYLEHEAPPEKISAIDAVVHHAENKLKRLEEEAERLIVDLGPEDDRVVDLYERLDDMEPSTFRKRAGELLHGLGFEREMMLKNTEDMSGGWRMRVALAQALFAQPALLLLDEPSNHLDLGAVVWLENYLAQWKTCLVMVSHSQDFLDTVCTNIIDLTPQGKLVTYSGNYSTYKKTKAENETNQLKLYKKEQDEIAHAKRFIASCGTFSNLVKQAKSRQKQLDKMYARGLIEKPVAPPAFQFFFPHTEPLPPPLIAFEKVSFSYSGRPEDYLYANLDRAVTPDARVALVGPNGAGKSTLLKLMVGELDPCEGQIRRHIDCKFARFHQHSAEALPMHQTPLEFLMEKYADRKLDVAEWRKHIGRYGVTGAMQTSKMATHSDGQRSRMVFALMALENPNVLLLDEPTNHLDVPGIDALAAAINAYSGAVVLVSHDFRLLEQVAKELWVCDNKTVENWPDGDCRTYKQHLIKTMAREAYVHAE